MKKMMKRMLALLAAFAMIFTMNVPAFAMGSGDKVVVHVKNVEASTAENQVTVYAYRIVKATYNEANSWTGYEAAKYTDENKTPISFVDPKKPTADEIAAIDLDLLSTDASEKVKLTYDSETGLYDGEVGGGIWLINVEGGKKIYNPMIVSARYDKVTEGTTTTIKLVGGTVDATGNFTKTENGQEVTVYAKSTDEPPIDKNIVKSDNSETKGDDVAIGDTVKFKVTTTIPSYSDQYKVVDENGNTTSPIFKIIDTLSDGLDYTTIKKTVDGVETDVDSVTVTVGGKTLTQNTEYTVNVTANGVITINFASDYLLSLSNETAANREVVVTYNAKLNENASTGFDPNDNKVKVTYSDSPSTVDHTEEKSTHTYTFGIDTNVMGEEVSHELTKIGPSDKTTTKEAPLGGAVFTLTKLDDNDNPTTTTYTATSTTASDTVRGGQLTFKGLDAGKYTLVETSAPEGYSVDSTVHTVEIKAEYNEDKTLKSYSVIIDNKDATHPGTTFKYEKNSDGKIEITEPDNDNDGIIDDTVKLKNTPISELPSTGGIGTTLFTIGGVALMAVAVALLAVIMKKRKMAE